MNTYIVDFDDLYDEIADRVLERLLKMKADQPALKVTLFTIPNRTSAETIAKFKPYKWIALAPHGYHHTRGECLTWTANDAEAKILFAREKGIDAPCFRAPAWLINRGTYEACRNLDIVICDHKDDYLHVPHTKVYRYNDPAMRKPKTLTVHGHLTNCAVDNWIEDMANDGRLTFPDKAKFLFPWEAAKEVGDQP